MLKDVGFYGRILVKLKEHGNKEKNKIDKVVSNYDCYYDIEFLKAVFKNFEFII